MEGLKGKALTVLGPVDPAHLGHTLPHEHLIVNGGPFAMEPTEWAGLPVTMENLGTIRYYPFSVKANITIDDAQAVTREVELFKQAGGGTIVDVTVTGLRHSPGPELLPAIATATGVNIITGTGYYVDSFLPAHARGLSSNQMADAMYSEIVSGCEGVRCGVIGEIGCSYPLTDIEKTSLQAAAMTQTRTGAPLIVHPGRDSRSPAEVISILEAHGADISRTVMSHLDRTFHSAQDLLEFASLGSLLEYDLFGLECSHYQINPTVDMPSDAQRIQWVKLLLDHGCGERIMIAHDLHTKIRMAQYGGHGFSHIINHIVPKMAARGIPQEAIDAIVKTNPQKWLTFV